jgi:tryptophan-rich sensory protein
MNTRVILFLLINFTALALGGLFTRGGANSEWYVSLNQAPWTPPGWVFGTAWSMIMIFLAWYMAFAWQHVENNSRLVFLYGIQWILNVLWNPLFFYYHQVELALLILITLTLVVGIMLAKYRPYLKARSLLLLPYILWLLVAISLNGYILLFN